MLNLKPPMLIKIFMTKFSLLYKKRELITNQLSS